ncbi:hypothetical protein PMIN01_08668 [Paraphaeosphaeria minitans]|uniref:Uncharacterized protein n=1 Tax=Paraphaeosphaeria minitans TaxID=565426 RepID=A0A9P6KNQ7_9PLEO|nr:hypothetical protein PMIN01_08668 [Paraphaeosphaeria minitans]
MGQPAVGRDDCVVDKVTGVRNLAQDWPPHASNLDRILAHKTPELQDDTAAHSSARQASALWLYAQGCTNFRGCFDHASQGRTKAPE